MGPRLVPRLLLITPQDSKGARRLGSPSILNVINARHSAALEHHPQA
jgi:hypothetical protein